MKKKLTAEERARLRELLLELRADFRELRELFERVQSRLDQRGA